METLERTLTGEQLGDEFMNLSIKECAKFFNRLQSKANIQKTMDKVWASPHLTGDGQHFLTTTIRESVRKY